MRPSREQLTADTWRETDPARLSDKQATDLATLACAEIMILSAKHFIQNRRQLVSPGRRLGSTWLYAPLRGTTEMKIGGKRWTVGPNAFALIPAGVPHEAVALTKRFEVITIHVRICLKGAIPNQPLFDKPVLPIPNPAMWHRQLNVMVSLERGTSRMQAGVPILRYLFMSLVERGESLLKSQPHIDLRIARALSLMPKELESRTVLQDIRQRVGLSHSQFNRLFRAATGMSPRAYHKGLRMQGVLSLLRDPGLSIKQIAARLGYYDAQHLEKEFKAEFEMTPKSFRLKL